MKKHKYILMLGVLVAAFSFSSCDSFLDEDPKDMKPSNKFWKTKADAQSGVDALYYGGVLYLHDTNLGTGWTPNATMWPGIISGLYVDKRKDRTLTNASEGCTFNIESFDDPAFSLWHEYYKGISRANFVLANIPRMTNVLSQDEINNYLAQGKFFRAYGYFNLIKDFGDVPYITEPYTSPENMYVEPTPAADIYKYIETDLLDIINNNALPDVTFYNNGGYVTRAMAETLLAEVYLQWAGAPINGGNEYYDKAAKMALKVINSGTHHLEQASGSSDDLNSAFNVIKTTKSSDEIIFAKEYNYASYSIGNPYACRSAGTEATLWKDANNESVFNPNNNVMYNAYLPCNMIINSYAPEDIRGHEKQFFFKEYTDATGISHEFNNIANWMWFDEKALTEGHDGDYNVPIMRYSEVLLIAAEGLARTGHEANTEGGALYYLNQVRKRAGLPDETATGDALIQSILTERLHEFPLEFKVWDDIRRTRLYPEADGVNSGKLKWTPLTNATIQNKPDGSTKVGALPEYVLLWPIPLDEMQRNPALEGHQNPGWN
ncbi:RagB/SusD family nutrient uptake outer membrane protein [Prevotella sp. HCN-7019]|uniref:RagB/SusD family nutrient uptake outer membrane protein n=1 Tax=Prevotella sp. HCN-7019 TaxID=3134668 RepID=UPI0030BCD478